MRPIELACRWVRACLVVGVLTASSTLLWAQTGEPLLFSAAPTDQPGALRPPADSISSQPLPTEEEGRPPFLLTKFDPPNGFTGPSGILPREVQSDSHFVPVEDRWRIGFPDYDRYGKKHPPVFDYMYERGAWWDPYHQNVLKGDYPIVGQNLFLNLTATSLILGEGRHSPIATTPFESTNRPFQEEFFGRPNNLNYSHFLMFSVDLFHGDTSAFKPVNWRVKLTPVFNYNALDLDELAVTNPDVRKGSARWRSWWALQEWFVENHLADLSPDYDFISVRAGSQFFNSDFRGLIFADTNRGVRLFGNRRANRDQFNLVWFKMLEKDTNSQLNTFDNRSQDIVIANYYRQDFIWPGYTAQASFHYNHDDATFKFDRNNQLVRPAPIGVFQPHGLDVFYFGFAGDGHIGRYNISHAYYFAFGRDSLNPISNQGSDISAHFFTVELSYDRDWARFRTTFLWASGDGDVNDSRATGFDSILDFQNITGSEFSYWGRQAIGLFGVNLVNRGSVLPDLRPNKIQGQSNFVNPGIFIYNVGLDMDISPKFRMINNVNFMVFDKTNTLEAFVYQGGIERFIGTDLSMGFEYRPLLSNNIILLFGAATLIPGTGFKDLYNRIDLDVNPLWAGFVEFTLTY